LALDFAPNWAAIGPASRGTAERQKGT
jgi:hypothetical protein